jgi:hypothetical protein
MVILLSFLIKDGEWQRRSFIDPGYKARAARAAEKFLIAPHIRRGYYSAVAGATSAQGLFTAVHRGNYLLFRRRKQ